MGGSGDTTLSEQLSNCEINIYQILLRNQITLWESICHPEYSQDDLIGSPQESEVWELP